MTAITVSQIDDDLGRSIQEAARIAGVSVNTLLLQVPRQRFPVSMLPDSERPEPRNDLRKFRKGWVEDPECEAVLREFGRIDGDWIMREPQ